MKQFFLPACVIAFITIIFSCSPAKHVDESQKGYAAEWNIRTDTFKSTGATLAGKLLQADCQNNNQIWVTFGSVSAVGSTYHLQNYSHYASLDSTGIAIDIAHGDIDYLSVDNRGTIAVTRNVAGQILLDFDSIRLAGVRGSNPTGDTIVTSGFIYQR